MDNRMSTWQEDIGVNYSAMIRKTVEVREQKLGEKMVRHFPWG